jgi:alkyl hydroperoxide reductase subunit AhpF
MALIPERDQATLRAVFAQQLAGDVTITYFTQHDSPLVIPGQECAYCRETRQLLEELAALSDRLHLQVKDFVGDRAEAERLGIPRIPAILLEGRNKGRVRFFGVPSGYEFATLVEDLLDISTGHVDLAPETREALQGLDEDVHIQVFVTPT